MLAFNSGGYSTSLDEKCPIPKHPRREKLMQKEHDLKKGGKGNACSSRRKRGVSKYSQFSIQENQHGATTGREE